MNSNQFVLDYVDSLLKNKKMKFKYSYVQSHRKSREKFKNYMKKSDNKKIVLKSVKES